MNIIISSRSVDSGGSAIPRICKRSAVHQCSRVTGACCSAAVSNNGDAQLDMGTFFETQSNLINGWIQSMSNSLGPYLACEGLLYCIYCICPLCLFYSLPVFYCDISAAVINGGQYVKNHHPRLGWQWRVSRTLTTMNLPTSSSRIWLSPTS